jgi:hypothetical protein
MDQQPEITPLQPLNRKREIHQISIWELLATEWNLGLMQWANDLKKRLIMAKRQELNLERLNLLLAGGYLWPASLTSGPAASASPAAPLEPHVSDREIEALTLRIATRADGWDLAGDGPVSSPEDRLDHLPPYAAAEVRCRVDELRRLLS